MQLSVIEAARNLAGIKDASTSEFGPTKQPLVGLMEEWTKGNEKVVRDETTDKGGTMRLGAYPARLKEGSRVAEIYGSLDISERHRHRYEVNASYIAKLEKAACHSRACRRTASCRKSSSCQTTPGSSACSSTRN